MSKQTVMSPVNKVIEILKSYKMNPESEAMFRDQFGITEARDEMLRLTFPNKPQMIIEIGWLGENAANRELQRMAHMFDRGVLGYHHHIFVFDGEGYTENNDYIKYYKAKCHVVSHKYMDIMSLEEFKEFAKKNFEGYRDEQ